MPVVSVVLAGLIMRSCGAIRLGMRIASDEHQPQPISSLLTLDPRFEGVRIQCADTVGSSARYGYPETGFSGFRQTRLRLHDPLNQPLGRLCGIWWRRGEERRRHCL